MAVYGGPDIVTDGLVLHLDAANNKSYPGSGNTWYDLSDNGSNGTLTNGPVFSLDNKGSITFDGVDDIVPSINTVSRLSNSCTEVWFKADGIQPTGNFGISRSMIFGYSHVGGTFSNFVTGPIVLAQSNKIYTSVTDTQGFPSLTSNTTINNNNVYYHVCLNKDTVNGSISLYINGIFDKSTTFNPDGYPIWAGAPRGSNSVEIGGYTNGTGSSYIGTGRLKGSVAIAKMYSRILSVSEILQNYNALKGRFGL